MTEEQHKVQNAPEPVHGEIGFITKQPAGESLVRVFLGASVQNNDGDTIGDVHDVMFGSDGSITSVLLGVGGFVGIGEKIVALPFSDLTIAEHENQTRSLVVATDRRALENAPEFIAREKTTLDSVSDLAADLGQKAAIGAGEIKDQAVNTVNNWRK